MKQRKAANPAEWTGGPSDWREHPLPEKHITVGLDRPFSTEEMASIRLGSIPRQMEDKWFLHFRDDQLFFLRSWTGLCVYVARFQSTGDGALLVSADINRDPEQYTETDAGFDARMVLYLIDTLLLGREGDLPGDPNNPLKLWSLVGRLMLGQRPESTDRQSDPVARHDQVRRLLHAIHAGNVADGLSASLSHTALQAIHDCEPPPFTCERYHHFENWIRRAPLQWTLCQDTLVDPVPDDPLDDVFLVPENTRLRSSARLTTRARTTLNFEALFPRLPDEAPLGSRFLSEPREAGASHHQVEILVCREPGKPSLIGLRDCLLGQDAQGPDSPGGFARRYQVPVWGGREEDRLWVEVLSAWATGWMRSIQRPPVLALLRFPTSDEERAHAIAAGLREQGVPCFERSQCELGSGQSYSQFFSESGSSLADDPSTLIHAVNWERAGWRLTARQWEEMERAVNSSTA